MNGISGRGANTVKVGDELSADGGISEVSLHHTEFALGVALPPIKLNLLALYCLEFALMCSITINVSNNAGILEINDGIVDEELGGGERVENVEVVIFDPRAIEIGSGICACMKRNGVLRVVLPRLGWKSVWQAEVGHFATQLTRLILGKVMAPVVVNSTRVATRI